MGVLRDFHTMSFLVGALYIACIASYAINIRRPRVRTVCACVCVRMYDNDCVRVCLWCENCLWLCAFQQVLEVALVHIKRRKCSTALLIRCLQCRWDSRQRGTSILCAVCSRHQGECGCTLKCGCGCVCGWHSKHVCVCVTPWVCVGRNFLREGRREGVDAP